MKTLQTLTAADLTDAFQGPRSLRFIAPEEATEFAKWVPTVDFSKPTEVPPSPVALNPETIALALLKGPNSLSGQLAAIVLVVYWSGGKIFYTRESTGGYIADVNWPAQTPAG
jgi:hypothetical protein